MPGPAPKNPLTRQRRNKKPTHAVLDGGHEPLRDLPAERPDGGAWKPATIEMWGDVQTSPMHAEYVRVDYHLGLAFALAFDNAMTSANKDSLGALRPFVDHFGLSPRSRRTLQWEIKRVEEPKPVPAGRPRSRRDPRDHLRAVS